MQWKRIQHENLVLKDQISVYKMTKYIRIIEISGKVAYFAILIYIWQSHRHLVDTFTLIIGK